MSAPTDREPLRLTEIEHLGTTASDLLADRTDGVAYPTDSARRAADAFASALREEPTATLRALQVALRRVQLDVQENGRARTRTDGADR